MKPHKTPSPVAVGFGWPADFADLLAVCEHETDGTILDCTSRFAAMLGFAGPQELVGADLFSYYLSPSDPAHLLSLLDVDGASEPLDICIRRADGLLIWVLETATLTRTVRRRVIANFVDITDRKLESLLNAQRADAEAMVAKVVAEEVMANTNVSALVREFRTVSRAAEAGEAPDAHASLSPREMRVLVMTGHGRSLKEIATELGISLKSVSTYRSRVMAKIGAHTTADLVAYVVRNRLK